MRGRSVNTVTHLSSGASLSACRLAAVLAILLCSACAAENRRPIMPRIDGDWWDHNKGKINPENGLPELSFSLTKAARELTCGQVYVEGSVLAFKDTFVVSKRSAETNE